MDLLSDILNTLDMKGIFYFRTSFAGNWGVTVPQFEQAARFHLVVQGQLHVSFPSGEALVLGPGDLILIPHGCSHILSDSVCSTAPALETVLTDLGYDGNGVLVVGEGYEHSKTKLVCGHFDFRKGADHPLLRALPDYFVVTPSMRAANPILDDVMRILLKQVFSTQIGSTASVTKLSEIMFIELLRINLTGNKSFENIMAAFTDQKISQAISVIHAQPDAPWTVESLALEIGMSRSRFAHRFKELMGLGPMAYLLEWRLQKSLSLLDMSNMSVQQISSKSGYKSSAAFTRAFSSQFGISPTEYRKKVVH
ncbi:MAG: AraC family transcriptional regulator [Litorimonas sp.]